MFNYFKAFLGTHLGNEEGQGMVEYALIIALVAILLIVGLGLVQGGVDKVFTDIGNTLNP